MPERVHGETSSGCPREAPHNGAQMATAKAAAQFRLFYTLIAMSLPEGT